MRVHGPAAAAILGEPLNRSCPMPRVIPSQVVLIEEAFPKAPDG